MADLRPRQHFQLLLLLLHLLPFGAATPADIEVDLVFPVANQTYKKIWPFPIIFAIRNASQLWQGDDEVAPFSVRWSINGHETREDVILRGRYFDSGVWDTIEPFKYPKPARRPDDGVYLLLGTPFSRIVNGTERVFSLTYETILNYACPTNSTMKLKTVYSWGRIFFYLDKESSQLPDFSNMTKTCPLPVGNFEFTGLKNVKDFPGLPQYPVAERCMNMAPQREPNPCGLKLDEMDFENHVRTAMLELAGCPNGTCKLAPLACNAPRNSANFKEVNGVLWISSILISTFALCKIW
ncbi:uncharacterized protein CTRU02_209387 [Colletotrichum truncatum]|uniref:Uncharacterized protein n=1 Tax=Colletotrichum truncatum TaxID=5467 RepID=A0ACC3YSF1_COLTU